MLKFSTLLVFRNRTLKDAQFFVFEKQNVLDFIP